MPVETVPEPGVPAADAELLGVLQSFELTARDLYQVAIDAGADGDVWRGIRDNHRAYADRLSGQIGRAAPDARDEALFTELESAFATIGTELATAAYDLESTLLATHGETLGALSGADSSRSIASILMVEARHCAVLADLAGLGEDFAALFDNEAEPVDVAGGGQG